jgi:hypothetical protein
MSDRLGDHVRRGYTSPSAARHTCVRDLL